MRLALFFTYGVSLQGWRNNGTLKRDARLYVELAQRGWEVVFVTYGDDNDAACLPAEWGLRVLTRPAGLSARAYARRLPFLHREGLAGVDLIKSHQINGSRYAAWSSLVLNKPFLARCGYLPSIQARSMGFPWRRRWEIALEERFAFARAAGISLVSQEDREHIQRRYGVARERIHLCPNWIDTDQFRPMPGVARHPRRIITVGRLEEQKRPLMLVEAVEGLPGAELLFVGRGSLRPAIEEAARARGVAVNFLDQVENEALPEILNSATLYATATCWEGSPKAILEAMSCGLPVVATAAPGVENLLRHGEQGVLTPLQDVAALRQGLRAVLDDPVRGVAMGEQGRRGMVQGFSVAAAVTREEALLRSLMTPRR